MNIGSENVVQQLDYNAAGMNMRDINQASGRNLITSDIILDVYTIIAYIP